MADDDVQMSDAPPAATGGEATAAAEGGAAGEAAAGEAPEMVLPMVDEALLAEIRERRHDVGAVLLQQPHAESKEAVVPVAA